MSKENCWQSYNKERTTLCGMTNCQRKSSKGEQKEKKSRYKLLHLLLMIEIIDYNQRKNGGEHGIRVGEYSTSQLDHFHTGWGPHHANSYNWGLATRKLCEGSHNIPTVGNRPCATLLTCPITIFIGGLPRLHETEDDAVDWLSTVATKNSSNKYWICQFNRTSSKHWIYKFSGTLITVPSLRHC